MGLRRRRWVPTGREGRRGAIRGPRRSGRRAGRRARLRRGGAGHHLQRTACGRMNGRRGQGFGLALALLLAWLVVYPILIVAGGAPPTDAPRAVRSRPGERGALW